MYSENENQDWTTQNFEQLVLKYQSRLCGFIYSIVGELELAQDLTQETFLRAYRDMSRRQAEASTPVVQNMAGWLYTIARNAALAELRRRKIVRFLPFLTRSDSIGSEEAMEWAASEPGGSLEERLSLSDELSQAMQQVGEDKLVPLLLFVDGFAYKEIAEITDDSLSNVKVKIYRAKRQLSQALHQSDERVGIGRPMLALA